MLFKTKYAGLCVLGAEIFYPPSQKATGVNPWMNARWVPSVALAKEGTLRPSPSEVGYGRRRSEGSARRSVWRGATAVRPWGSTHDLCRYSAAQELTRHPPPAHPSAR